MFIQYGSLFHTSSLMNFSYFHISVDYIIYLFLGSPPLPPTWVYSHYRIVVEVSPIKSLPADCRLLTHLGFNLMLYTLVFSTFVTFTLSLISYLRCSQYVFTSFQQFKGFWMVISNHHSILFTNMGGCQQFSKL